MSNFVRRQARWMRPSCERLETRNLLTSGIDTFASIPVAASALPGGTSAVTFTVTQGEFTPGRSGALWLRLDDAGGPRLGTVTYPATTRHRLVTKDAPVVRLPGNQELVKVRPGTYTLTIGPAGLDAPAASVEFALAGDATGAKQVTAASTAAIRAARGRHSGDPGYVAAADVNNDGVINRRDIQLARANLGAVTTVRPLALSVATVLRPTSPLLSNRTVVVQANPGTQISLMAELHESADNNYVVPTDAEQPTVAGTADANGLASFATSTFVFGPDSTEALGSFDAQVRAADTFGQYQTGTFQVRDALNEGLGYIAAGDPTYDPKNGPPASESAGILPASVDLTSTGYAPPVFNQGTIGSCTANAVAWDYAYVANKEGLAPFTPSRSFIYYNARVVNGRNPATLTDDDGSNVTAAIQTTETTGIAPESLAPYQSETINVAPPASAYAASQAHKVLTTYQIDDTNIRQIEGSLAAGYPVIFAVKVIAPFLSAEAENTGVIPTPQYTDQIVGGHAMVLVGYDNNTRQFEFVNSWGSKWGKADALGGRGYGTIPFSYVTSPNFSFAGAFYSIRSVS